jgi:hypothetical protein
MNHMVIAAVVVTDILYLCMAVMARSNNIRRTGGHDLIKFYPAESLSWFRKSCLKRSAATAAAKVVCPIGNGIDKVFFAYSRFKHKSQIIYNLIAACLSADIAWILDGKFDF